ncbi:MAG: hypothetical protein ABJN22_09665 [Litorimonas sp.]
MTERFRAYLRRKFFKKLGPAVKLASNPMDISVLWKQKKHSTFAYNPEKHSYVDDVEQSHASQSSNAIGISTEMLFRVKSPIELKVAQDSIGLTFYELEKISSIMGTNYQTAQF